MMYKNKASRWNFPIQLCQHLKELLRVTNKLAVYIKDEPFNGWFVCSYHRQSIKLTPGGPSEIKEGEYHYVFETYKEDNIPTQHWIKKQFPGQRKKVS